MASTVWVQPMPFYYYGLSSPEHLKQDSTSLYLLEERSKVNFANCDE